MKNKVLQFGEGNFLRCFIGYRLVLYRCQNSTARRQPATATKPLNLS